MAVCRKGHPDRAFLLPYLREIEARAILSYLDFEKFPKTEAEVAEEVARQADRYIEFGLNEHPKVRMAKGKFKDSLDGFAHQQPEHFDGRFDIPVVVLGGVPAGDIFKAAGANYFLKGLDVKNWSEDPNGCKSPKRYILSGRM